MVACIVVTHGRLAEEIVKTAKTIFGDFSHCYAISNEDKSPQSLFEEMKRLIDSSDEARWLIFVDFIGGSCCHACVRLKMARDDIPVITGVNLPMFLAFLNKRDSIPFDQLPGEILDRGHNSIQVMDPSRV